MCVNTNRTSAWALHLSRDARYAPHNSVGHVAVSHSNTCSSAATNEPSVTNVRLYVHAGV